MGWKCYSCGTENSKEDAVCKNCGNTVAAPKSFYSVWILGSAFFFMVFYMAGTMAGGVLVEAVATPSNDTVLAIANEQRSSGSEKFKSLLQLKPEQMTAAKAVAVQKAKSAMSPVVVGIIQWFFPAVLFVLSGIIVGFISDGFTIIEPGIGSVIGQVAAAAIMIMVFKTESFSWTAVVIGILPGAGFGILGAWFGEIIQDKKDRAGGITA